MLKKLGQSLGTSRSVPASFLLVTLGIMTWKLNAGIAITVITAGFLVLLVTRAIPSHEQRETQAPPVMIQTITNDFEASPSAVKALDKQIERIAPRPVEDSKLQILLKALRVQGCDTNAPVIETDGEPVRVRDIVKHIVEIAEAHGDDLNELAREMPKVYEKIWDNVPVALERFQDLELITIYVARKSMVDIQWKDMSI